MAIINFVYTFGLLSFFCRCLKNFLWYQLNYEIELWQAVIFTVIIFSPFVWIRTVEKYRYCYIFAIIILALVLLIIIILSIQVISENNGEAGPDWTAINNNNFITMLALSFYTYSNIG